MSIKVKESHPIEHIIQAERQQQNPAQQPIPLVQRILAATQETKVKSLDDRPSIINTLLEDLPTLPESEISKLDLEPLFQVESLEERALHISAYMSKIGDFINLEEVMTTKKFNMSDSKKKTLFIYAAQYDYEFCKLLLNQFPCVKIGDSKKEVKAARKLLIQALEKKDIDFVKLLLLKGAKIESTYIEDGAVKSLSLDDKKLKEQLLELGINA